MTWTNSYTSEVLASIEWNAHLGREEGDLRLRWTATNYWTGEKRECENLIWLTSNPQPFGGRRWYLICPRTGDNALKLYLPLGAYAFASRKAYRLGYQSQRETARDRAFSRAFALRRKLGDGGGIGDDVEKPKGMHWSTFERAIDRISDAEEIVEGHSILLLQRFTRKTL